MLIDALFMLGLLAIGAVAGLLARHLPLNGVAALVLAVVPLSGIPLSMIFC